ncbi:hypothetical protein FH972_009674 [Carpinus fangiana]|uniref:Apple domain-containing protein n=1 Tax=Carpinus fangiana TaxID=176857 RepID=A0A660KNQ2_9ROSI|nr:hypothetical protein FH972_009674 [Carpinus fangiana]
MPNTDWPGSDYEYFHGQTDGWCRAACLDDCLCAAAIYQNGTCWKKRTPLSNGRTDSIVQTTTLIKIRKGNSTLKPPGVDSENKDNSTLKPSGKKDRSSL